MAGFAPGYWDQEAGNYDINDQTLCRIPNHSPGVRGDVQRLASPEPGLEDDVVTEFVVFLFADAALAVVRGIEELGFSRLVKTLFKRGEKSVGEDASSALVWYVDEDCQ